MVKWIGPFPVEKDPPILGHKNARGLIRRRWALVAMKLAKPRLRRLRLVISGDKFWKSIWAWNMVVMNSYYPQFVSVFAGKMMTTPRISDIEFFVGPRSVFFVASI